MFLSRIAKRFIKDERGVTAIEYAIIGVAISALVASVFATNGTLGQAVKDSVSKISDNISKANTSS